MYQKCPICNGTGTLPHPDPRLTNKCEVCNGTKIIDEMTGLPPARMNNLEESNKLFDTAINIRKLAEENSLKGVDNDPQGCVSQKDQEGKQ